MVLRRLLAFAGPAVACGLQAHGVDELTSESMFGASCPQDCPERVLLGSHPEVSPKATTMIGNDPQVSPTDKVKFHITQPGQWPLVGLPNDYDDYPTRTQQEKEEGADLVITGNFQQIGPKGEKCDDLSLRGVEVRGRSLEKSLRSIGNLENSTKKLKRLKFWVADSDVAYDASIFNQTSSLGFEFEELDTATGVRTTHSYTGRDVADIMAFSANIPICVTSRPTGAIKVPTKKKFRHAQHYMTTTCTLAEENGKVLHEFGIMWHTVWGGVIAPGSNTAVYSRSCPSAACVDTLLDLAGHRPEPAYPTVDWYKNDQWLWISNVGTNPAGVLGPHPNDDRLLASVSVPGCYKPTAGGKEYLHGPFSERKGPKHPRHWR